MKEIVTHWWLLTLRGLLAIGFAGVVTFLPGLLHSIILQLFALPFLITMFALYCMCDGALLLAVSTFAEPGLRRLLVVQAVTTLIVGFALFAVRSGNSSLRWLLLLSIVQSGLNGTLELIAASHMRRHLAEESFMFAGGVVCILFSVALLIVQNGELGRAFNWLRCYATFFGLTLVWFSLRLRTHHRRSLAAAA